MFSFWCFEDEIIYKQLSFSLSILTDNNDFEF